MQVKMFIIRVFKYTITAFYSVLSKTKKVNNKKAVFVLSREAQLEGNLEFVYQVLLEELDGIEVHFIYTKNRMNFNIFKEIYIISNARYLIIDDYYLSLYLIRPSKTLKVVQLWHAAGAFKKFGFSAMGTKFSADTSYLKTIPIHSNYTHVYVSSESVIPFYAEAFNMPKSNIYPTGIPRIDLFNDKGRMNEIRRKINVEYPHIQADNCLNILFAPTYRAKGSQSETDINIPQIINEISKRLVPNARILFKAHPFMPKEQVEELDKFPNVFVIRKYLINEWMLLADVLVTDYSSSIFDFSLLEKPIAHFVPDIDQYIENRGFYQQIKDVSDGEIITELNSLIQWLNAREKDEHYNTSRMIKYNFDNIQDVSQKVVKHFINH